jgi:hypothetical protein
MGVEDDENGIQGDSYVACSLRCHLFGRVGSVDRVLGRRRWEEERDDTMG